MEWDHNALKAHYLGWFTDIQTVDHVDNWFDAWGVDGRPVRCSTDLQVLCDDHGRGTHTVGTLMGDATSDGCDQLGVDVYWATVSEENLRGFHLHRRVSGDDWMPLTMQPIPAASPSPTQGHAYHYLDRPCARGDALWLCARSARVGRYNALG